MSSTAIIARTIKVNLVAIFWALKVSEVENHNLCTVKLVLLVDDEEENGFDDDADVYDDEDDGHLAELDSSMFLSEYLIHA